MFKRNWSMWALLPSAAGLALVQGCGSSDRDQVRTSHADRNNTRHVAQEPQRHTIQGGQTRYDGVPVRRADGTDVSMTPADSRMTPAYTPYGDDRDRRPMVASDASRYDSRTPVTAADTSQTYSRTRTNSSDETTAATERRNRVTDVASEAPPLTRSETPSRELGRDEFWVPGHWQVESNQYVWVPGRVEQHRAGVLYHSANWVSGSRGWEYTPEHWE